MQILKEFSKHCIVFTDIDDTGNKKDVTVITEYEFDYDTIKKIVEG